MLCLMFAKAFPGVVLVERVARNSHMTRITTAHDLIDAQVLGH